MSKRYALVTGASGLLGSHLIPLLKDRGYTVIGLAHRTHPKTDIVIRRPAEIGDHTDHLHLVINLAGLPILGRPWTASYKRRLRDSRIGLTERLINSLITQKIGCDHFISGSAIGYYGATEEPCLEDHPPGSDFSAQLCADWEKAALGAEAISNKLTLLRTGLVLTPEGGFLDPFRLPVRLGLRMIFGDGQQWLSWIDYRDWLGAVLHIVEHQTQGVFNLTAPTPVRQSAFSRALMTGRSFKVPIPMPRPLFVPLGEMKILLIDGQKAVPAHLEAEGYRFHYPTLQGSLDNLTGHR